MAKVLDLETAKVITGHESLETAKLVHNYPYGFKKTDIRYWIENNGKKGMRFVSQTLNPKTLRWNKPKKSTYCAIMLMVIDKNDFVSYKSLYTKFGDSEKIESFLSENREYLTNDILNDCEYCLKQVKKVEQKYKNATFTTTIKEFHY